MGCGGVCEGHCTCATRKAGEPRRFGIKAHDEAVLAGLRAMQLEDPAGIAVMMPEEAYLKLKAELEYWKAEAGSDDGGCGCPR